MPPTGSFGGGMTVTFPEGCSSHALVSFGEFAADQAGSCIPAGWPGVITDPCACDGGLNVTPAGGTITPTTPTGATWQAYPANHTNDGTRWQGEGTYAYYVYVDGVGPYGATYPSSFGTVSIYHNTTYYYNGSALPLVDITQSHTYSVVAYYEDVPSWQTWVPWLCFGLTGPQDPGCNNVQRVTEPWGFRTDRGTSPCAPGGAGTGICDKNLGSAIPFCPIVCQACFYNTWVEPPVIYTFAGPSAVAQCSSGSHFGPSVPSACNTFVGAREVTPQNPYTVFTTVNHQPRIYQFSGPDYEEHAFVGANDETYYGSYNIWVPSNELSRWGYMIEADTFIIGGFGVQEESDLTLGVWNGVQLYINGVFNLDHALTGLTASVQGYKGPLASNNAFSSTTYGTEIDIEVDQWNCIAFAERRHVGGPGSYTEYWVNGVSGGTTGSVFDNTPPTRARYGILDGRGHGHNAGYHPRFYIGNVQWDKAYLSCPCFSRKQLLEIQFRGVDGDGETRAADIDAPGLLMTDVHFNAGADDS